jgi:hypothetical protein
MTAPNGACQSEKERATAQPTHIDARHSWTQLASIGNNHVASSFARFTLVLAGSTTSDYQCSVLNNGTSTANVSDSGLHVVDGGWWFRVQTRRSMTVLFSLAGAATALNC